MFNLTDVKNLFASPHVYSVIALAAASFKPVVPHNLASTVDALGAFSVGLGMLMMQWSMKNA